MDNQKELAGRYEIRLKSRKGRVLVVDRTDCLTAAASKAHAVKGALFDTQTGRVFSEQTGTWLKPLTQEVIEGELAKQAAHQDYKAIAVAIGRDLLEVMA